MKVLESQVTFGYVLFKKLVMSRWYVFLLKLASPILFSELPFEFKIVVLILQVTRLGLSDPSLGHCVASSVQARLSRTILGLKWCCLFLLPQRQWAVSYL